MVTQSTLIEKSKFLNSFFIAVIVKERLHDQTFTLNLNVKLCFTNFLVNI